MKTDTAPLDRIGLMQTFVHIVEAGSLSAAAAQIGTTQPTSAAGCRRWNARSACGSCAARRTR